MKLPRWLPHPASWASAVALFIFAIGVSAAMAVVMPLLFELMRHSLRLAWLGILCVWLAPIPAAGAVHRVAHGVLDLADTRHGITPASSLWAGFVAWAAIILVSMTASFVMLVIDPPPIDEPDALLGLVTAVTHWSSGLVRMGVWIVLAAYVYELERRQRS
jgi:hypothetical protein